MYVSGLVLASLVIPAIVQQWSDRQKSLELKNGLVTALSELVGEAATNAILLRQDLTPEARGAKRAQEKIGEAKTAKARTKAEAAYQTALDKQRTAEQKLLNTTRTSLLKSGFSLEARLQTYFSDSEVADAWSRARSATTSFLVLATNDATENEAARVLDFLCEGSKTGPIKAPQSVKDACNSYVGEETLPPAADFPYSDVGNELVRLLRVRLLEGIRKADADGYSDDGSDLFWNVIPGVAEATPVQLANSLAKRLSSQWYVTVAKSGKTLFSRAFPGGRSAG